MKNMFRPSFGTQSQRIYNEFEIAPRTMLQVSRATGIERANICRRVAELRRARAIYPVGRGLCPISKDRATFYTTSPRQAVISYVKLTKALWGNLNRETAIDVTRLIRDYVYALFDERRVVVPASCFNVWWEKIKPAIDKEAKR